MTTSKTWVGQAPPQQVVRAAGHEVADHPLLAEDLLGVVQVRGHEGVTGVSYAADEPGDGVFRGGYLAEHLALASRLSWSLVRGGDD